MSGIDLMQGRGKVEGASGRECIDKTQGSQRVQECIVKMQVGLRWSQRVQGCVVKTRAGSGWSQRVWDWQGVLGDDSDDSGMM